jgi:hypothetical protein
MIMAAEGTRPENWSLPWSISDNREVQDGAGRKWSGRAAETTTAATFWKELSQSSWLQSYHTTYSHRLSISLLSQYID